MNSIRSSAIGRSLKPSIRCFGYSLSLLCAIACSQVGFAPTAGAQSNARDGQSTSDSIGDQSTDESSSRQDNGSGGGSFADFQSLIDLIQTTVVPDTWEALGGPSTMAPYPQGVYVDASGTLLDCKPIEGRWQIDPQLQRMPVPSDHSERGEHAHDAPPWRQPSSMRFVSLNRLTKLWNQWQQVGRSPSEAMRNLAGLSHIEVVFFDGSDIVLGGTVHGIHQHEGWYRDQVTHRIPLQFEFLRTALWSSFQRTPFGCTIDPTQVGLQQAAEVGQRIQSKEIGIQDAKDSLLTALGMQRVEVFGIPGDTPTGYIMVEADRHMKRLALGKHPMPQDSINYLDAIDESIAQGPPQELLLRLWFTAKPREVFSNQEKSIFELRGDPVRLSSQNERAQRNGARGLITKDQRTESFVKSFNSNWASIRESYAIYGAIESIFEAASVAQLVNTFSTEPEHFRLIELLSHGATASAAMLPTPRQVASIGTLHTVRHGSKRHHVLIASGGVMVSPADTLSAIIVDYPIRSSKGFTKSEPPRIQQQWWWDATLNEQRIP